MNGVLYRAVAAPLLSWCLRGTMPTTRWSDRLGDPRGRLLAPHAGRHLPMDHPYREEVLGATSAAAGRDVYVSKRREVGCEREAQQLLVRY